MFKKLVDALSPEEMEEMIEQENLGRYGRRIWFLFECLTGKKSNIPDLKTGNLAPVFDEKLQNSIDGVN